MNTTPGREEQVMTPDTSRIQLAGHLILWLIPAAVHAGEVSIQIEERKQRSLANTIVELVGTNPQALRPSGASNTEIKQQNKEFIPLISIVPLGSAVLFSNEDPFQHHVYSVSKGNRFDLPLYQDTPPELIRFDTPGVVKLGCNIHDWMLAFSYVSQSGYLVRTDVSGKANFSDVPVGEYQLRIWNPRMKNNKKVLTSMLAIAQNQSLEQTVKLSLRKKIRKPARKKTDRYYGG